MNTEKVISRDNDYILHTYGRSPVVLAAGEGMAAGRRRQAVPDSRRHRRQPLGYCHPAWVRAVADRPQRCSTPPTCITPPRRQAGEALCARTGLDAVFFGNSGAEANEGAIKCARKYSVDTYGPARNKVITLVNSFHGRTLATLTATGQDVFHHDFGPFPANFDYVPAGDFAALEKAADANTCAVMLELVQGEGGVVALDADYVAKVAAFCREKDILLIVDEVQTGVGRTGRFLACEHFGLKPDIVTLAKGLGGGLPIGAVVMSQKVAAHMGPGSHGSTFGGNPVCCAGALAVLDTMDEAFLAQVRERAAQLRAGLAALPHVQQVSGLGLMVGIELADGIKAAEVRAACEREGLLVLTAKTRLRLLPPLILTADDVDDALATLRSVLEKCV
ncbi:MAG: aspartate aminotransferase family protein [Gemmiger sp.]